MRSWLLVHGLLLGAFVAGSRLADLPRKAEPQSALAPLNRTNQIYLQTGNSVNWNEPRSHAYVASAFMKGKRPAFYCMFFKVVISALVLAAAFVILRCFRGAFVGGGGQTNERSLAIGGAKAEGACGGSGDDGDEPHKGSNPGETHPEETEEQALQKASEVLQKFVLLIRRAKDSLTLMPPFSRLRLTNLPLTHMFRECTVVYSLVGHNLAEEKAKVALEVQDTIGLCLRTTRHSHGTRVMRQRVSL